MPCLRHNRQEIEERLRSAQGHLRCRVETHSVESSIAMVAEGIGIFLVHALIGSFIASERVKLIPLEPESWSDYGIITLRNTPLSRPMHRFIDMLREMLLSKATLTRPT